MSLASKVLLVERDPQFIYLIQRYANTSGCQLIIADSVSAALEMAGQEHPDLILLDVSVQGTDCWPSVQALKTDPATRAIRVYICSSSEVSTRGWEEYADGCLLKPVMYEDFASAVTAAISRSCPDAATPSLSQEQEAPVRKEVS